MAVRDIVTMGLGSSYFTFIATLGYGSEPSADGLSSDYRARVGDQSSEYRTSPATQDAYRKAGGESSSYLKTN